ncbi:unnamed protein product [Parnassius apollo]|uniref:(apollo) hypothetical protein n=1 Tax=Parnassius apollo TaxID=110799 RepID=A0A8S3XG22_PARAO|nr:unnamed protein product [Parnassius apollo]
MKISALDEFIHFNTLFPTSCCSVSGRYGFIDKFGPVEHLLTVILIDDEDVVGVTWNDCDNDDGIDAKIDDGTDDV